MKTYRCNLRPVRLLTLVCLILRTKAQIPELCVLSETNRAPENSDINVVCGTEHIDLSIYLCPVYQALYNESLMVLNGEYSKPECFGAADWNTDPPILKFRFPINDSSIRSCNNRFEIINQIGSGEFSDFSNVQFVNISGTVTSVDPSAGMITYLPKILYKFSCLYPMQYLLNNTQLAVSGVNLAIRDNNGSFISTLSMTLYKDQEYQEILTIPQTGLNLKTKVYVAVEATNLTDRFNVLLDRCYATASPYPMQSTSYDLIMGCTRGAQTKVELNGVSQKATFSFEAFRFVEHMNETVSTFYLHCATRLCEVSSCSKLIPNCSPGVSRRKREALYVSNSTTLTSPAILVTEQRSDVTDGLSTTNSPSYYQTEKYHKTDPQVSSVLNGASSHSMSSYSIPVVAVIFCNVISAMCFSV